MIPYGRQSIIQQDVDAVVGVLNSDFLTQGPQVPLFEGELKKLVGAEYAIAVNSATSALHLACLALGVGSGDLVWTSPITFVASANCALYCGAKIDFVDIDAATYNLSTEKLEQKLHHAKKNGLPLPKVVIPVHFSGQSCEMAKIQALSNEFGFSIIEDASHAIGGKYRDNPVGSCKYSDITVFSFHPVKIITSAEGGVAVTNDAELAKKIALLRSHGITRDKDQMTEDSHGSWYYQQIDLGFNYRMTDIQAALGLSQLKRLHQFLECRHHIANYYTEELKHLPITLPFQSPVNYSAFHLYVIRLKLTEIKYTHRQVFELLRERGIGVNLHYIPVHLQPYYKKLGFDCGDFPEAENYYKEAISLPIFPELPKEHLLKVVSVIKDILQ